MGMRWGETEQSDAGSCAAARLRNWDFAWRCGRWHLLRPDKRFKLWDLNCESEGIRKGLRAGDLKQSPSGGHILYYRPLERRNVGGCTSTEPDRERQCRVATSSTLQSTEPDRERQCRVATSSTLQSAGRYTLLYLSTLKSRILLEIKTWRQDDGEKKEGHVGDDDARDRHDWLYLI